MHGVEAGEENGWNRCVRRRPRYRPPLTGDRKRHLVGALGRAGDPDHAPSGVNVDGVGRTCCQGCVARQRRRGQPRRCRVWGSMSKCAARPSSRREQLGDHVGPSGSVPSALSPSVCRTRRARISLNILFDGAGQARFARAYPSIQLRGPRGIGVSQAFQTRSSPHHGHGCPLVAATSMKPT